ncbi:TonB-dependent siderophore receptor [Nostoc sp. NMS8]|uniref:TonB-dependent siderophore receptor n=1 Tax=Nostoc sp. NMS8 TaxID=2815392 RepID=UPI0025EC8682|nr:TonB-dependent siderophore receptor [Nostoc sp. NMS8]MBN3961036.1 TonB-dependent siderophore receptor [Nostoc sp. NMS8]
MKLDKLFQSLLLTGTVVLCISTPGKGEEVREDVQGKSFTQVIGKSTSSQTASDKESKNIPQLSEIKLPATSAQMLVQTPTPNNPPNPEQRSGDQVVTIMGVKANPTNKGVELILETTRGEQLQVTNRSIGNNFIADIPGAQLRLASGEAFVFRSEKTLAEITEITVTNVDANTVRVTVVGEKALPTVELFDDNAGLVFGINSTAIATSPPQQPQTPQDQQKPASETPQQEPTAQQDEPIELVVTGEQDGYNVPDTSTATKTDTPLRDIPQSIQVVPRQVLEDRKVRSINEAVETVSGVVDGGTNFGAPSGGRVIRGFVQTGNFRNGYRDTNDSFSLTGIGTIEQVEVLKGPASVLFGAVEPGGIVNVITKQPLSEPYYSLGFEAGNFGYYQPSIDFSGPLNADKTVLYRFIASYQSSEGFQDFVKTDITTIAPSITLKLGDRTDLNLYYEYTNYNGYPNQSGSLFFSDGSFLPRSVFLGYPDLTFIDAKTQKFGYALNHKLSDNWQIRNNFAVATTRTRDAFAGGADIVDDRSLVGISAERRGYSIDNYFGQIDLLGKFKTGSILHQILVGFDFNRNVQTFEALISDSALPDLDIFNPDYNISNPVYIPNYSFNSSTQSYGAYLQDQISILDNLKLLVGGRLDWVSQNQTNSGIDSLEQNDSAFSPRFGLVYQPSKSVSLYTSYSQSFLPTSGFNPDSRAFKPTKGTQYEAGIKADFLDGKLSTTLAAYQITKTNITIQDQNNRDFQIQVGEQRSRGIELDIAGEILPGWKVIGSYAYTDAEVTEDIDISVGNKLLGVPENQASLWTTYEIQKGDLKGLGFGLGLFYVGKRAALSDNSVELPNYLRTDAAIFYRRDSFNAAINIRNLFDTDYFSSTYGYTLGLERGAPLTIIGSIRWEL